MNVTSMQSSVVVVVVVTTVHVAVVEQHRIFKLLEICLEKNNNNRTYFTK